MRRHLVLVTLTVFLIVTPVFAQEVLDLQFFPVVARGAGFANTMWVTDLVMTNPMDVPITIGVQFFPANQDNQFNPFFPDQFELGPGKTAIAEDLLQLVFGYEEGIKGSLVVLADPNYLLGNPEGTVFCAVTRTYNVGSAAGTFGQTVPSLVVNANVGWASSFITGVRNDADFRSNLGIANTSPMAQIKVYYRIRDRDGTTLAEGSKNIKIMSMNQWSFQQLGVDQVTGPLSVELWLDPSSMSEEPCEEAIPNAFMAYVSKVDNVTGDAEFLSAAAMKPYYCGVNPED
ncbi:MAG: hypothetical protein DRJ65_15285 [Acidobacteria bacterium]|nr:MAG: hypothetical protein DRJ65_15285 [Acidobacteriota bacterium]